MKLFQKSALAVAIAAVPFLSVNAMEALDDATLSEMTGQAGVTIESTLDSDGITVGSIQYTDEGSVYINDISVKSDTVGGYTSTQTIDVDTDGNLLTRTVTEGGQVITVGAVELRSTAQAMSHDSTAYVNDSIVDGVVGTSNASGANLVSNLSMTTKQAGASYANILNLSDKTTAGAAGAVNNGAVVEAAGVYTHTIDGVAIDITKAVEQAGNDIAIVTLGSSHISNLDVDALSGAVGVRGLKMHGGRDGSGDMTDIRASQVIWAVGEANTLDPNGVATAGAGGVYIQGSDASSFLEIDQIQFAGQSIGSVMINNIQQKGSVTRIYGH